MATTESKKFGDLAPSEWPGERLGLAESGSRSVARIGRRFAAILIDWGLAMLIAKAFFPEPIVSVATLSIFVITQIVFLCTLSASLGHTILGLRLVTLNGSWIGIWRPIVRTLLLAIALPALVWDSDQRGFHDKIAGTVLIRR